MNEELKLVAGWFEHIEQLATDRKTANGYVMSMSDTLDEIRCLAKDSRWYMEKHLINKEGE